MEDLLVVPGEGRGGVRVRGAQEGGFVVVGEDFLQGLYLEGDSALGRVDLAPVGL
jgi:hypothetical protein